MAKSDPSGSTGIAPPVTIAQAKLAIARLRAEHAASELGYAQAAAGSIPDVQLRAARLASAVAAERVKIAAARLQMAEEERRVIARAEDTHTAEAESVSDPAPPAVASSKPPSRRRKAKNA